MRILILDDSADDRAMTVRLLAQEFPGLEADEVFDQEGFDRALEKGGYAAVVTDDLLRWSDGIQALKIVKARWRDCPVVLFTSSGNEEVAVEAIKAGADDYVNKSVKHAGRLPHVARRSIERAALNRRLSDALRQQEAIFQFVERRSRAKSLEEMHDAALEAILSSLRCERASILLLDDSGVMRFVAWRGLSANYRKAVEGPSPWKLDEPNPRPVCIPDIAAAELEESLKAVLTGEGVGALAFIPLRVNGRLAGKFMTYYNAPHAFNDEEIELSLTIARQIAFGIERWHAEEALRRSEERYRAVVESQAEMLCRFRPDGTILFVNGAYARARGTMPDALMGRNFWDFVAEEHRPGVRAMLDRLTAQAPEICIENRFETTDGVRWTLWTNCALRFDVEGRWTEAQSSGIDITERKQTEEKLRESEERFRTMADSSPVMIWMTDAAGRLSFLNRTYLEYFGIAAGDAATHDWPEIIHPDDRESYIAGFMTALGERKTFHERVRLRRFDGQWRWFESRGNPILDEAGNMAGFIGSSLDITEIYGSQQALKELDQRKDEFLANMSHEIRSPLTGIMGYADILLTRLKDPLDIQCLQTIKESGDYLIEIVNDILDLSKIEAGKLILSMEAISPHAVLAEIQSLMDVRAREKNLPLVLRYDGVLPASMQTDRTRLRQIVINLVSNAIKFTDRGRVEIVARFLSDEGLFQIEVIDTGIGIAPEQQARLFEPFTQGDSTSTRKHGGTGLGLTITRRLVEMLGGSISLETEPDKGSTFRVLIPTPAQQEAVPVNAGLPNDPVLNDWPLRHHHVLVVDDREEFCYLVSRYIEDAGGRATAVSNGEAAIEALEAAEKSDPFHVVILDIQMPGIDGYETARRIRAKGFQTPILALTAGAMVGDREKCLQAGCNDYLTKPIDRRALIKLVARYAQESARLALRSERKLKVLLVDDSHSTCELLRRFLAKRGHEVRSAHDGQAAVPLAQQFRPDVIVLDLRLPDMNGYELMRRLKQTDGVAKAAFIGVSGYRDDDAPGQEAVQFDHFLEKPLDLAQLEALLRSRSTVSTPSSISVG